MRHSLWIVATLALAACTPPPATTTTTTISTTTTAPPPVLLPPVPPLGSLVSAAQPEGQRAPRGFDHPHTPARSPD